MIVCKVRNCPFCSKNGFCLNKFVVITAGGQCGHIYNENGSVKKDWQAPVDSQFMRGIGNETEAPTAEE